MSNRNKATHIGHCQACNSIQKLPAGVLSKHGYEVAGYGFFNGICFGAGHKPLEQDKSIVEKSIEWAQEQITRMEANVEKWSKPTGEHFAWLHEYVQAKRRGERSRYRWIYTPVGRYSIVLGEDRQLFTTNFAIVDGKVEDLMRYSIYAKSTAEIVAQLNAKYVEDLKRGIQEVQRYIKDQQERIRIWHAKPLEPVK